MKISHDKQNEFHYTGEPRGKYTHIMEKSHDAFDENPECIDAVQRALPMPAAERTVARPQPAATLNRHLQKDIGIDEGRILR